MDAESNAFQRSLLKLFQGLLAESLGDNDIHEADQGSGQMEEYRSPELYRGESPPLDLDRTTSDDCDLEAMSPEWDTFVEPGEIPAVQERFHALLKRRLQIEIERHPPLFPWETEIQSYGPERSDYETSVPAVGQLSRNGPWIKHLTQLSLPVAMPEAVLAQLLKHCQEMVQSSLREGAKLVRAVEDLFPGQDPALHYLAGLVMASPVRSGGSVTALPAEATYPSSYESAETTQQMVLSLLAAQQILTALTLTASAGKSIQHQWLTAAGPLSLQVDYCPLALPPNSLRVEGGFPQGGSLTLRGNNLIAIAQRGDAGSLSVELLDLGATHTCRLEMRLSEYEQEALVFVIKLVGPVA